MGRRTVGGAEIARGTLLQAWQHRINFMMHRERDIDTEGTPMN